MTSLHVGPWSARTLAAEDGWSTPQSKVPAPPPLVSGAVPHEEVFWLPDDAVAGNETFPVSQSKVSPAEEPRLTAEAPLLTHLVPRPIVSPKTGSAQPAGGGLGWQEPASLLAHLEELGAEPATRQWATETAVLVRKLGSAVSEGSDEADSIFQGLEELAGRVAPVSCTLHDRALASRLRRAGHALSRRVAIWRQVVRIGPPAAPPAEIPKVDPKRLSLCLAQIDALTDGSAEGQAWREYLLLDALRRWSDRRPRSADRLPPSLAEQVLRRLTQIPMSAPQQQFVSRGPVAALRAELERHRSETVDPATLLRHLERYELSGLGSDAQRLAEDSQELGFSPSADRRRLAERLRTHYRNANLRVTVTVDLLNRLIPAKEPEYAPVRDRVLGVAVHGQSLTSSEVGLRFIPDPSRARMALEICGQVASLTTSTSGPATFINDARATYTARKPLELDLKGIHLGPAEVQVSNQTRLRNLRTQFDGIPLIGSLVKSVARAEHQRKRAAANREVIGKIARRAKQRIDTEAGAQLGEVSEKLRRRVLDPLSAMALEPVLVSARTTDRRLTMRLRLAGKDQLGSHTPRPMAPSNNLASFQVHQTAINNVLERLELDGRTFALPELSSHVAARLGLPQIWETDPEHDDMQITFAKRDALGIQLKEGRVALILSIAKLSKPPRRWRNFQVRAFFRPQLLERSIELTRDGIIHLVGNPGSKIALRSVLAQMFPKRRPMYLTPERLETDPRFAELKFTQLVIDDGWIGVAWGPKPKPNAEQQARRQ